MKISIQKGDEKPLEHKIDDILQALQIAVPALPLAINRGIQTTILCTDEHGCVFRITTPKRPICKHHGIEGLDEEDKPQEG